MWKLEGTVSPAKIMSLFVLGGGLLTAVELESVSVALAAIFFATALYLGRKKLAQLMMKYGSTRQNN